MGVAKARVRRANGVEGIALNSVWERTSSRIDRMRFPLCWTNGMSCSDAASGCGCTTWSVEGDVTGSVAVGRAGLDGAVDRAAAATAAGAGACSLRSDQERCFLRNRSPSQCGTRMASAQGAYDLFCESIVAVEGAYNPSCDGIVAGEGGAYDPICVRIVMATAAGFGPPFP